MAEETTGQATEQPAALSVEDQALNVAQGILQAEESPEEKPRDDKGKFVKAETEEKK